TATITVTVTDNGTTANGGVNSISRVFTVTVTPVNQAPTLNALANVAINENAGTQTVNLSGIGQGPGDTGQTLTVTATSDNPALIPTPAINYTSPNATGVLTYTPLGFTSGNAVITVTVTDDGGTVGGAINTFSQSFTVTVNPINQPPTLDPIVGVNPVVNENS